MPAFFLRNNIVYAPCALILLKDVLLVQSSSYSHIFCSVNVHSVTPLCVCVFQFLFSLILLQRIHICMIIIIYENIYAFHSYNYAAKDLKRAFMNMSFIYSFVVCIRKVCNGYPWIRNRIFSQDIYNFLIHTHI